MVKFKVRKVVKFTLHTALDVVEGYLEVAQRAVERLGLTEHALRFLLVNVAGQPALEVRELVHEMAEVSDAMSRDMQANMILVARQAIDGDIRSLRMAKDSMRSLQAVAGLARRRPSWC